MPNPFSDFQLISYAVDGEIRLWDIQDLGCVKVIRIEGSIGLLNVVAHPTEPNVLFAVIITKKEAGLFLFLASSRRHSLLEAGPVQHHVASFSLCCPHPQHKHNRSRDSRSDGKRRPSRRPPRRRFLHLSSFPSPSTADSLETPYSHGCFLALAVNRSLYIYNSLIDHLWLLHGVSPLFPPLILAILFRRRCHPPPR